MNALEQILANLAAMQGKDAVKAACQKFVLNKIPVAVDSSIAALSDAESSVSSSEAPKRRGRPAKNKGNANGSEKSKEKKERKPRGQTSWNKLVEEVLKEMRDAYGTEHPDADTAAVAKAVPYKVAFEEAGKRKRASDPEAQRMYAEKKAAKLAAKVASYPPLPPSSKTSQSGRTLSTSDVESIEADA